MTIVQTSPNLGLTVRMQRLAAPAPAASGGGGVVPSGDVVCTGWLVPELAAAPEVALTVTPLGDDRTEIFSDYYDEDTSIDYSGLKSSIWVGVPVAADGLDRARPVPGAGFICEELTIDTTYYKLFPGRCFMALATGGTWTVEWDSAPGDPGVAASGHRAIAYGGTLVVETKNTDTGSTAVETLTARAFSGADQIAVLLLTTQRIAA
ncbi:hypothetical protein [Acidovorax sp. Leaf78]|uniref:hypothetical protein n=1 Tax=Acidovorax sp. Leaf78 TaxID=1736237 RepID=UPI0006FA7743|nr:hypothetical protein [Acidovorax sp. Leaf78]KQO23499.1 hypothetical protein ASF16_04875 [Acidovorax sp. Leaf78]